jgi:hypothetical protein
VDPFAVVRVTPLVTAVLWSGLAIYLIARDRYRTWTEVLFLVTAGCVAGYALADAAFFNAATPSDATAALLASLAFRTLLSPVFLLLAAVLHSRLQWRLAVLAIPAGIAFAILGSGLVANVAPAPGTGVAFTATYAPVLYAAWLALTLGMAVVGLALLALLFVQIRRFTTAYGRRMLIVLGAVTLALAAGEAVALSAPAFGVFPPPLLSSLFAIPGAGAIVALSPERETPFLEAARKWKAKDYRPRAAFLTYGDEVLLGSAVPSGDAAVDGDLYSSTLEVVQDFMRTSFPMLKGRWLRSIEQGEYAFVLERGAHTCLILLIQGQENDQLRRLMREALRMIEAENREAFEHWRSEPGDVHGVEAALAAFLAKTA